MKFRSFINSRIMNEAAEADGGGIESYEANDYSSTNAIGEDDGEVFKSFGLDPNKYGLGGDPKDEQQEDESQGSEDGEEAGQNTDEKSLLDVVNSMGLVHNGNPLKVENIDEVKNALQMYKDYTVKTQSLSEERKAWEAEKTSTETELKAAIDEFNKSQSEYGQQLQEMQQWTFALNQLQENAPDVFEEVQRAYNGVVKQFSNPILDQQLSAINKRLSEAESHLKSREDKLILDSFESEKSQLNATEQSLKELGVNIDWNEVKKQWAATGLPLKQVVGSIYFENVAKAQASKSKVETTKQKLAAKPIGAAGSSRPGGKVKAIDPKLSGLQYASALLDRYTNNH